MNRKILLIILFCFNLIGCREYQAATSSGCPIGGCPAVSQANSECPNNTNGSSYKINIASQEISPEVGFGSNEFYNGSLTFFISDLTTSINSLNFDQNYPINIDCLCTAEASPTTGTDSTFLASDLTRLTRSPTEITCNFHVQFGANVTLGSVAPSAFCWATGCLK